jgi:hypothetical protein
MRALIWPSSLLFACVLFSFGLSLGACQSQEPEYGYGWSIDKDGEYHHDLYCGDNPDETAQSLKEVNLCIHTLGEDGNPIQGKIKLNAEIKYQLRGCLGGSENLDIENLEVTLDKNGKQCVSRRTLNGVDWVSDVTLYSLTLTTSEGKTITGAVEDYKYEGASLADGRTLTIQMMFNESAPTFNAYYEFAMLVERILGWIA